MFGLIYSETVAKFPKAIFATAASILVVSSAAALRERGFLLCKAGRKLTVGDRKACRARALLAARALRLDLPHRLAAARHAQEANALALARQGVEHQPALLDPRLDRLIVGAAGEREQEEKRAAHRRGNAPS